MFKCSIRGMTGLLIAVTAVTGCSNSLGLEDQLVVDFAVAPAQVRPGGSVAASFTLTNTSASKVTLSGDPFCGGALKVEDEASQGAMQGTQVFCIAVVHDVTLEAGETETWVWDLRAQWESGPEFEPGLYKLVVDWKTSGLDAVSALLEVLPTD